MARRVTAASPKNHTPWSSSWTTGCPSNHALATANFRLGEHLFEKGLRDNALKYFVEARRLRPESWSIKRQTWELEQAGKASGPEFFAEVMALVDDHYYAPLEMKEPGRAHP